jgi:hypothetical protein
MVFYLKIPAGSRLYRAAITEEQIVQPRYCPDTGKTGGYFSIFHPFLSETMADEYHRPLILSQYNLNTDIAVILGKYSSNLLGPDENQNVSHIEFGPNIIPINRDLEYHGYYAELFIKNSDLNKLQFLGSSTVYPAEVIFAYHKNRADPNWTPQGLSREDYPVMDDEDPPQDEYLDDDAFLN